LSRSAVRDRRAPFAPDVLQILEACRTFNGKLAIEGGVTLIEIGGHAPGSCVIRLDLNKIVFTGDDAYLEENWTGPPFALKWFRLSGEGKMSCAACPGNHENRLRLIGNRPPGRKSTVQ
jgi:glyoxylase-like metal-dependent hydrolase (beta-lactamase superfamily II)